MDSRWVPTLGGLKAPEAGGAASSLFLQSASSPSAVGESQFSPARRLLAGWVHDFLRPPPVPLKNAPTPALAFPSPSTYRDGASISGWRANRQSVYSAYILYQSGDAHSASQNPVSG